MAEEVDQVVYQILALALEHDGAVEYFARNLPASVVAHFGKGHSEVYRCLLNFYERTGSTKIDKSGFMHWLNDEDPDIVLALGGKEGLEQYLSVAESIDNSDPGVVTAILKHRVRQNQKIEQIKQLSDIVESGPAASLSLERIDEIATNIIELNRSGVDPLKGIYDSRAIARDADNLWELPDFLPTQFPNLNEAIAYDKNGGFVRGAVHAILAQSGLGKSTFAKSLMKHWLDEGLTCLYINYEETRAHWERILFSQITGQNIYRGGTIPHDIRAKHNKVFKDKLNEWDDRLLVKHDPETPFFEDLEHWVRSVVRSGRNIDVLFVDTIQSMFLKGKTAQRWGQFEEMMVRFEKLAKDIDCAIILTAQENTNRMKEKREVVQQSDTGGSITIAQKCTVSIFITKAKLNFGDDSIDDTVMQLQIPKNRITGVVTTSNAPLVKYNDNSKSYEPFEIPDGDRYDPGIAGDGLQDAVDLAEKFKTY